MKAATPDRDEHGDLGDEDQGDDSTANERNDLSETEAAPDLELPPTFDADEPEGTDDPETDWPAVQPGSAREPTSAGALPVTKKRGRWRRRLIRSVLAMMAVGAIVAGVVFGWPVLNDRVLQPVADNSQDTAAVQGELTAALERVAALESEVAQLDGSVTSLATAQSEDLATVSDQIGAVTGRIDDVDTKLSDLTEADRSGEAAAAVLGDRLSEVKAMELLSRARLFLYQANYGLAAQDVASARAILGEIDNDDPMRTLAVERLGVVLVALPDRPVAASADLDIAWQALLGDVPAAIPLSPDEPAPGATSTSTTTPGTTTTGP